MSEAAVVGVRPLPGRPGLKWLGDSPSPELGPGTAKPEGDGVRPGRRGGGTTGE